jgi:hypothetical protein
MRGCHIVEYDLELMQVSHGNEARVSYEMGGFGSSY